MTLINKITSAELRLKIWISAKFFFNREILFGGSAPLAFFGLVLGVAILLATQSVMRGFEQTLKKAMIDTTSDVQVIKKGKLIDDWNDFSKTIKKADERIINLVPFAYTQAVLASQGQVSGVLIQGINLNESRQVLNLSRRLKTGEAVLNSQQISIGVGLAKKFKLKIGDEIYLAVSLATPFHDQSFKRQAQSFKVGAIYDFGKNDWNERLVVISLLDFQKLTQIGDRYTGAFVKLKNSDQAQDVTRQLEDQLGSRFTILNWYETNKNLFKAVQYEGVIIFFVVFLIVIVAAFNISSTLYVLIRQRFKDIAILKSLGATQAQIQFIFVGFGLWVATLGCFLGFILGLIFSQIFMLLQKNFTLISGSVYKIDRIDIFINPIDFLIIYVATLLACLLATYAPAKKGSGLDIVAGLKQG